MILMRFPGGRAKALTLSYDDGVMQDERLVEILDRHGIKCTFNLNSGLFAENEDYPAGQIHRRMTKEHCIRLYKNSGHETAVHAYTHPHLENMHGGALAYQIAEDIAELERTFGGVIRGMAYPFGTYNDEVIECLKNCGIAYSRTVRSTHGFGLPKKWLELDPTCHHNDKRLGELCESFLGADMAGRSPIMFYLWGHAYEFEMNDNWNVIEEFAAKMGGHEDIWYAANIEIYDYIQAFNSLRINCDGNYIENPSAADIWFERGGKTYCIKGGEALYI